MMKKVLFVMIVVFAVSGCGTKPNAGDLNTGDLNAGDSNDKDTVQVVTPDLIRLDSMTFNKEVLLDSPFSAETLLSLAKVHSFEDWLYNSHLKQCRPVSAPAGESEAKQASSPIPRKG